MNEPSGSDPPKKQAIVYRSAMNGDTTITIAKADIDRLEPGEFLNDTLIEFQLAYVFPPPPE
jgi:Ulp1 family protease